MPRCRPAWRKRPVATAPLVHENRPLAAAKHAAGKPAQQPLEYDLGNEFFALFLDETMAYSCGLPQAGSSLTRHRSPSSTRICQKLALTTDDHVLEIGTGWGSFALHAAKRYSCRVTTTTISRKQYEYSRRQVAAAGLAERITVLGDDYRAARARSTTRLD